MFDDVTTIACDKSLSVSDGSASDVGTVSAADAGISCSNANTTGIIVGGTVPTTSQVENEKTTCDVNTTAVTRAKVEATITLSGNEQPPSLKDNTVVRTTASHDIDPAAPPSVPYQYVQPDDSRLTYGNFDNRGDSVDYSQSRNGWDSDYSRRIEQDSAANAFASSPAAASNSGATQASLFHHVPGENGYSPEDSPGQWTSGDYLNQQSSNGSYDNSSPGSGGYGGQAGSGGSRDPNRRRRRSRVAALDDSNMSSYEYVRSDAMLEGKRLLLESLREKVSILEDQCQRLEREKCALGDLLTAKKSDYEQMKEHFNDALSSLEEEVQRLHSEKVRLLDKLQLPESERASLAAEENEIADLKRKLEEYENRFADVVGENDDLRQEVRDLQLEMAEMHDQFREGGND